MDNTPLVDLVKILLEEGFPKGAYDTIFKEIYSRFEKEFSGSQFPSTRNQIIEGLVALCKRRGGDHDIIDLLSRVHQQTDHPLIGLFQSVNPEAQKYIFLFVQCRLEEEAKAVLREKTTPGQYRALLTLRGSLACFKPITGSNNFPSVVEILKEAVKKLPFDPSGKLAIALIFKLQPGALPTLATPLNFEEDAFCNALIKMKKLYELREGLSYLSGCNITREKANQKIEQAAAFFEAAALVPIITEDELAFEISAIRGYLVYFLRTNVSLLTKKGQAKLCQLLARVAEDNK